MRSSALPNLSEAKRSRMSAVIEVADISIPPIFDMQSILNISCRHSEMAGYYFEVLETVEEPEAIYEGKMGECIRKQMFYTLQIRSERYMKSGAKGYERNIRYYQNINWR